MTILKENWKDLIKPSSIKVTYEKNNKNHATIDIEPLERGYGNTVGNTLRRVLLSSIRGFAITSIKIDGVLHEYSVINGVREDVIDIIMNVKSLIIKKETSSSCVLRLKANKKGVVTAKDIETENGVEILNKDLVICTIEDSSAAINMEMKVENGVGYVVADWDKKSNLAVGAIAVDALFSPVKRVAYTVKNARIAQRTDYDRLVLEIETDGSINPEDVVGLAAKIIQSQLDVFINFKTPEESDEEIVKEEKLNPSLFKHIDELELSVRSYNCLKNENIVYVGDLVTKTEAEMLKTSNFGRKSLNELKDNLKVMNLSFGMKLDNWPPKNIEELSKKKKDPFI